MRTVAAWLRFVLLAAGAASLVLTITSYLGIGGAGRGFFMWIRLGDALALLLVGKPVFPIVWLDFSGALMAVVPLWLLAFLCLAWPVTSFIIARKRKGRGFEVEPAD